MSDKAIYWYTPKDDDDAESIREEAAYWREYVERSKPGDNNCLLMALFLLFVPAALGVAGVMAWL